MQEQISKVAVARAKAIYDYGHTAIYASNADPRFHYTLYVPPAVGQGQRVELIIAVHGTTRTSFLEFRESFAEFGKWNNCAILCPVFPVNVCGDGARSGYKYMKEGDIRYDELMLSMVGEVAARYKQDWAKFAMFGYSGGGHFVHRFAILHSDKLWALSIGAPGSVTLLDFNQDWWVGIRNIKDKFGVDFNAEALARIPVQMIVGDADIETWEITHAEDSRYWMPGANDAGKTRPERLAALRKSFESVGVDVQFDLLPGVAHDRMKVLDKVKDFFFQILAASCKK
jgi:hypothetical protein